MSRKACLFHFYTVYSVYAVHRVYGDSDGYVSTGLLTRPLLSTHFPALDYSVQLLGFLLTLSRSLTNSLAR